MNGIPAIKDQPRRNGHGQCRKAGYGSRNEVIVFQCQPNRRNAGKHDRKAGRIQIPAEQRLRQEQDVEVKRAVVIRWIVSIEAILDHLIDEPAVNSLVKMWWLYPEKGKAQSPSEAKDGPEHPVAV